MNESPVYVERIYDGLWHEIRYRGQHKDQVVEEARKFVATLDPRQHPRQYLPYALCFGGGWAVDVMYQDDV